ncbi:hypothetical protein MAR_033229 [Mya arenaria]|uniref:Uncharacterized protein n=1 Tax=Mya arenaria TaxID=6604 RepID=A0ABY7GBF8_MYAAR|nr:hypothetical protein MAR_033229 [Mya arenaria]
MRRTLTLLSLHSLIMNAW